MLKEVAASETFRVSVDIEKNRIYMEGYGFITAGEVNEPFVDAVKIAVGLLQPRFTCLADFRKVELLTLDNIAETVQKMMLKTGMSRVAAVWGPQLLARMTVRKAALRVHSSEGAYDYRRQEFDNVADAEAWLDDELGTAASRLRETS